MLFKNRLRIDFNKNTKMTYYIQNIIKLMIPDYFYRRRLDSILQDADKNDYIQERVNYYNKLDNNFDLPTDAKSINEFKKEKKKTYFFDLIEYLRYFNPNFKISYLFGDITTVPKSPSFLKSRPIEGDNKNSILMKLNKIRHFIFVDDKIEFKDKKDMLVWRGKCYTLARKEFIKNFYDTPDCDIGQTNTKDEMQVPWQKPKMKLADQLNYKFILAIEGNDVASNLKWVMSSNSIAFMPKPTYETWFMEGKLIPNFHYVLLKDDFSDLKEKIDYYSKNIEESLQIIQNANAHVEQFKNQKQEDIISLLVLKKYFIKSKQIAN